MYSPHLPVSGPDLKGVIINYKAKDYEMPEPPISYSDLVECIRQTVKDGLPSNLTLQYLDIDGDWVMVTNQDDYHAMLECQAEHSQQLIQMSIVLDGDKMSPKVRKNDSRNPIMHIEEKKDMLESKEKPFKQEMKLKEEEENLGTQTDWRKKEVRDMVMQSIYPKIPQIAQLIGKDLSVKVRPVEDKVTHIGIVCSQCRINPITGTRYQCTVCENMNLCEKCEANTEHDHVFFKIKNPNQQKNQGIQKEQVVSKNDPVSFEEHDAFFVKEISTIPGLITVNDRMIHKAVCVKNVGAELWPAGTYVKNIGGAPGKDTKLIELIPGEEFSCVLTIENPLKPGDYKSQWRLAFTDEENELCYFGTPFVVNFTVVDLKSEKHVDEEGKSFQSAFDLVFVKEVCTMPAQINVEDEIVYKTILLRNSGKEAWPTNVFLRNVAGVRGKDTQLTQVNPGEQVSSILILENPAKTGSYTSSWRLAYFDEENRLRYAGEIFTVIVKVGKPETEGNSQKTYPKEMIEKALKIRDMFPEANIMETLELIAEYPKISLSELAENYMATHGDDYDYDDGHNDNYEETGAFEEYELKKKAFSKLCSLKK